MDFISPTGIFDPQEAKQPTNRNIAAALGMVIDQAIRMEAGQAGCFALVVYDRGAPETATCISNDKRINLVEVLRLCADRLACRQQIATAERGA
jgi:hypothetical protein